MNLSLLLVSVAAANPGSDNVVLNFTGPNCFYCQQMSPIVSRLQRQGYPIRNVNVTNERPLFEQMKVTGMPTFVLIVNGREVTRRAGAITEAELKRMCAQIPRRSEGQPQPPAADPSAPTAPFPASGAAPTRGDDASRFEFPFPGAGEERRPEAPANATFASPDPPAFADVAAAPAGSPEDWDRPVIRAQNHQTPRGTAGSVDGPLAASTRIRIRDQKGTVYASATVIDSRPGRSILLTCGHIFRDLPRNAQIVVDVFVDGRPEQYLGQPLRYDLPSDVGLLAISTSDPLPVSPISASPAPPAPGEAVSSIGCGGGDPPTRRQVRVTGFQRNTPPTYVECTGAPEQGRSGGGLFNGRGEIIGVCFAADTSQDRGLYASLASVYRLLDASGLSHLCPQPRAVPDQLAGNAAPAEFAESADLAPGAFSLSAEAAAAADAGDPPPFSADVASESPAPADSRGSQLAAAEQALGRPEDAEVICIIRPRNQPAAASRIVVIHRASPKFVSFLTGELRRPEETARRVGPDRSDDLEGTDGSDASPEQFQRRNLIGIEAATVEQMLGSPGADGLFSHFQMVSARGTSRGADTRTAQRPAIERYRRSASSRIAWAGGSLP
jgi:thiol-disulfide isomerase/thioredoxin